MSILILDDDIVIEEFRATSLSDAIQFLDMYNIKYDIDWLRMVYRRGGEFRVSII